MDKTLRWGVLATGWIAELFTHDIMSSGLTVAAVGSRSGDKAQEFADRFHIPKAHGSYEDLVADPDIDIIYIATPHPQHVATALLALDAGKHVLIEKPFTINAAEARFIMDRANEKGLVVLEAMWTRFLPHMKRIHQIIAAGTLGELRSVSAEHRQFLTTDPKHRLNNLELGGGALLDLGIYPISFAHDILGPPTSVKAMARFKDTGVDAEIATLMQHEGGTISTTISSLDCLGPNVAVIYGTKGRIEIATTWYTPTSFKVIAHDETVIEEFSEAVPHRGMQFQAFEMERLVRAGEVSAILSPDETIAIMGTLDTIRAQIGLVYPGENGSADGMKEFAAIIIGAGQAGPSLAGRLDAAGKKVAIIERKHVGGTCVNTGCKPTKTLVASAYAAHLARRASDYGVMLDGTVRIDMPAVMQRSHKVTLDSRRGNEEWLTGMPNCTLVRGHARFESANTVSVDGELLTAPQIFINVGGRAAIPEFPGVDDVSIMTNSDIVMMDRVPRHLVVIGGSYIGLEFAQMYRRFGAQVTVVEKGPRLVGREDEEVSKAIRDLLEAEGIRVRTNAECIRFRTRETGVAVGVNCTEGEPEVIGSDVLLAVGRRPNTDDLGLEKAGVKVDERGYIVVGDDLATSTPGIWAMGDCNGRGAFTHTAYNDFEIVAANLLDGESRRVSDRVPGYALFIDPPLGRVGMTEDEARKAGHSVLVGRRSMTNVGRAVEKGETLGLMKIVVDADTRKILGAAILGTGGDEAIHGVLDMMNADQPYDSLRWAVPIHPTVSELWPTVLLSLK